MKKIGLNCQAVSVICGQFLDRFTTHGGASLDCLVFEANDLYNRFENGPLSKGFTLFGDNAYLNSLKSGRHTDYNFNHSQVSS